MSKEPSVEPKKDVNVKPPAQTSKAAKPVVTTQQNPGLVSRMLFKPIGNVLSKSAVFFLGVGFSYMFFYWDFMLYLKKSDEIMKNEIHSLKRLIENNQHSHQHQTSASTSNIKH